MITETLIKLFSRDLNRLKEEINLYTSEEKIWLVKEGINNSAGNLCLHLCGNLQHFIGAQLGGSGYIRNREAEFKLKNIARAKLIDEIDATLSIVTDTLEQITKKDLEREYPIHVFDEPMTTEYFLIHLAGHLNYHLGQINYHRRLI
ncbi:MAG TPA: DinB family protein [Chitinophagaceae bacterium]|nr:DinB family protein [Chitinophagaceae bacterium]